MSPMANGRSRNPTSFSLPTPTTPPNRPAPRRDTRKLGLFAAVGLTLVFAAVIGWFVVRGRGGTSGPSLNDGAPSTEIAELPPPDTTGRVGASRGLHIQITDKIDPTRLAGELFAAKNDPQEAGRYEFTKPAAWVYLRDGRSVHIRSEIAHVYMPDRSKEPESGTFEKNVVIRVFAPTQAGVKIDPEKDTPLATATTESFSFDFGVMEGSTAVPVTIATAELRAELSDLTIFLNQTKQRIDRGEVKHGGTIRVAAAAGAGKPEKKVAAAPPSTSKPEAPSTAQPGPADHVIAAAAPAEPRETLYLTIFEGNVLGTQGDRKLSADRLDVWARLLDNKLPPGAIGGLKPSDQAVAPKPAAPFAGALTARLAAYLLAVQPEPADAPAAASTRTASKPEPFVLTWTGPLTLTPILDGAPKELTSDHLSLRCTSSKLVTFEDAASSASGQCSTLEYGATTRNLVLSGPGEEGAQLFSPEGTALASRMEMNLGTGLGHIPGPGVFKATKRTEDQQELAWRDRADFTFLVENDAIRGIREANFAGEVAGRDGPSSVRGQSARIVFAQTATARSTLSEFTVLGARAGEPGPKRAIAKSRDGADISGSSLTMAFKPAEASAPASKPGRDTVPTGLTAEGDVIAKREGAELRTALLEAGLDQTQTGETKVSWATGKGAVHFKRDDGVTADADEMRADVPAQIVDLIGEHASVSPRPGTTIDATQIRLSGLKRSVAVFGAGTLLSQDSPRHPGDKPTNLQAKWTGEMTFDDPSGRAECIGAVVATSAPDALTQDQVRAERVVLELEPRKTEAAGEAAKIDLTKPDSRPGEQRRLLRATAYGESQDREGGADAQVESRRYAAGVEGRGGRRLVSIMYLEGPKIIADNAAGTLNVPSAGKMLIDDRQGITEASAERTARGSGSMASGPGTSLFEWAGSMSFDRGTGALTMLRSVNLKRDRASDRQLTHLVAESLRATIRQSQKDPAGGSSAAGPPGVLAADRGELQSAHASGAVYMAVITPTGVRTKELIADDLDYDAQAGSAEANARAGNMVTVFDAERASSESGTHMLWDLKTGNMQINHPTTVTMPIQKARPSK
jgi:lipopolysaccharide export system protein LptA